MTVRGVRATRFTDEDRARLAASTPEVFRLELRVVAGPPGHPSTMIEPVTIHHLEHLGMTVEEARARSIPQGSVILR